MAQNVQQLAGGSVPGLEHCPPIYHVDVSEDEWDELIRSPKSFLERLGIPVPKHVNFTLSKWDEAFSETEGWQPAGESTRRPAGCCYVTDGGMICHKH
jgi:hypothetical protein